MAVSIELSRAHLTRQHGDLLAVYTWVNDERALVLIPAYRKRSAWYVVCESAAWKYDEPSYLASQCAKAAEVLGMEPSKNNWVKLATIIHDGLPDLIRMPAHQPPELNHTVGDVCIRADGEVMAEQAVKVATDAGVSYA